MDRSIRALVAVEGLDVFDVQRALPDDPSFELVGVADGVDETVRVLQEKDVDVVLVACQGREDDRSLQIIDGAAVYEGTPGARLDLEVAFAPPTVSAKSHERRPTVLEQQLFDLLAKLLP